MRRRTSINREGLGHDSPLGFVWIPIVYILSYATAICWEKSLFFGGILVYMMGNMRIGRHHPKPDDPLSTADTGYPLSRYDDFCCGKSAACFNAEMPDAGEHHGDPGGVGGLDHFIVADRSAGLDHRGSAGFDTTRSPSANGKKASDATTEPLSWLSEFSPRRRHPAPCARRCARNHPAHLAGADADGGEIPGVNDGVGF